jgi:glycosyltransferase involved in cell wall biosynthesis
VPEITVLLPNFNAGPFLRPAIDSILAQHYQDFELLVIDDGSSDGSQEAVAGCRDPRVRYIRHEINRGLGATLNEGLRLARGALIARQDCDDVSDRDRLGRQNDAFHAEPALALIGSRARLIDEDGRGMGVVDRPLEPASIRWYGLLDCPFIHTSVMFRRDVVLDRLGGYREGLSHSEDWELWSRLIRSHAARNLPDRLVSYRERARSMTDRIERPSDGGHFRAEFRQVVREIVAANLAAFGGGSVRDGDAGLLAGFVLGVPRDQLRRFLDVFWRLLRDFRRVETGDTTSGDFLWTLARQVDATAYRVDPSSRAAAVTVFATAIREEPRLLTAIPWIRAVSLIALGKQSRRRLGSFRRKVA